MQLENNKFVYYSGETLNTRDTFCRKDNAWLKKRIGVDESEKLHPIIIKAEKFRINYETLGNFMPFPVVEDYSLNKAKNETFKDQFDLFLMAIKDFYKTNKIALKNDSNINYDRYDYFSSVLEANIEYFKIFGNFKNYVEKNYLQDYIENYTEDMIDEEMNIIDIFNRKSSNKQITILPKTEEQINEYFDNLILEPEDKEKSLRLIEKRAERMRDKLKYILGIE